MKKILITLLTFAFTLVLASCGSTTKTTKEETKEIVQEQIETPVQEDSDEISDACILSFTEYQPLFESKDYEAAYTPWLYCFETCPKMSINLYNNGEHMVKNKYENASGIEKENAKVLLEKIFQLRMENYPNEKPAEAYSRHAMFMEKAGASEETVFSLLQQSYEIKPESLGIKAIFQYFDGIILRNKDTNVQAIFDMNDNLLDVVSKKIDTASKKLDEIRLKEDAGETLSSRDTYLKKAHTTNLKSLGMVEPVLSQKLEPFETCDRLLPLYEADYHTNTTNAQWLQRSISRLYHKGCTETGLYDKMVISYLEASPSADGYVKLGGIKLRNGLDNEAVNYFEKAIALETDDYKKAKILYSVAQIMAKKGLKSKSRSYAYKALKVRPSLGKAYLLIASLYASSASSCAGGNAFKQRMVYQAALVKARKAKVVDPSISSYTKRAINSYQSKAPSKKDVFIAGLTSGDSYPLGCWIGETVSIP